MKVTLILKNPAKPEQRLEDVPVSQTLAEVQERISREYPGNPAVTEQTVRKELRVCGACSGRCTVRDLG